MAYFEIATCSTGALTISYAILYIVGSTRKHQPWKKCTGYENSTCYAFDSFGVRRATT